MEIQASALRQDSTFTIGIPTVKVESYLNSSSLLQLHVSLVRPHLEYFSAMWDPHTKRHLNLLEGVQKFALRVCFEQYSGSQKKISS